MKKFLLIAIIILLNNFANAQTYAWTQKANYSGGVRYGAIAFSIGNKAYAGTGVTFTGTTVNYNYVDFWEYDPSLDIWTQKANVPGACKKEASGFSIGDKGYITCGWTPSQSSATYEYNPSTNIWTPKANFAGGGRYTAACFTIGEFGFVGLGYTPYHKDFWRYDPSTDSWTQIADIGGEARQAAVGFGINNYGYVFGGDRQFSVYSNELWRYDPNSNSWTQKTSCPASGRGSIAAFVINNKGYVGGGTNEVVTFNDFWEYDPITDSWTQIANFGGGNRLATFSFNIGNKGYVGTGSTNFYPNVNSMSDFWEYGPIPNSIQENIIDNDITLYPNPSNGIINISIKNIDSKNIFFSLFDLQGKLIKTYALNNSVKNMILSLSDLSSGEYIYSIKNNNEQIKTGKILLTTN